MIQIGAAHEEVSYEYKLGITLICTLQTGFILGGMVKYYDVLYYGKSYIANHLCIM